MYISNTNKCIVRVRSRETRMKRSVLFRWGDRRSLAEREHVTTSSPCCKMFLRAPAEFPESARNTEQWPGLCCLEARGDSTGGGGGYVPLTHTLTDSYMHNRSKCVHRRERRWSGTHRAVIPLCFRTQCATVNNFLSINQSLLSVKHISYRDQDNIRSPLLVPHWGNLHCYSSRRHHINSTQYLGEGI